jgi:uncharacterized membrane protein
MEGAMTFGERLADRFAAVIGSWKFILTQTTLLLCWIVYNVTGGHIFDEYPFILLNLLLSIQAAFTGPILLLSANRQASVDRRRAVKNLVIDQQDHEVIIRLEQHIEQHFHQLADKLGVHLESPADDARLCELCDSRRSNRSKSDTFRGKGRA